MCMRASRAGRAARMDLLAKTTHAFLCDVYGHGGAVHNRIMNIDEVREAAALGRPDDRGE